MADADVMGGMTTAVSAVPVLTGRARYCPDLHFPGMLTGKLLYSAYPSARIARLDVGRARRMPGVHAVLTAADIPGENSYFYMDSDQPLLVAGRVRYVGDALAAIAAEDEASAALALAAIEVEYEPLPAVFDPIQAMRPDAPRLWEERDNVRSYSVIECGNLEAGFAEADVVVEGTYHTPWIEHAFLETEGAVALVDEEGMMVIYASNQSPHHDRHQIARTLAIPENRVRVISPSIGGAFGGKDEAHVQIHAALLAQATGRPVRIIRTREESIRTHVKRHPIITRYRTGARQDGTLTAVHAEIIGDTGPYTNAGPYVMDFATLVASGPYYVRNARFESYTVFTNNPISGAMRGFGGPQVCFAYERQMDKLAGQLGIDPVEIRLRNGLQTGQLTPAGLAIREAGGLRAALLETARMAGWADRAEVDRRPGPHLRRGWGVASSWFVIGIGFQRTDYAGISVDMAGDGSVTLRTSVVELGQGGHTTMAILVAEALGVELQAVRVIGPDTQQTLDAGRTVATRQTFVSGNAALRAAAVIRDNLLSTAAEHTGLPRDILSFHGGRLYAEDEALPVSVAELAARCQEKNRSLHAEGYYAMEYSRMDGTEGKPYSVGPSSFGAQVAQVLVDEETGQVTVERLINVHNAGRVINPGGAAGQVQGACAMGIGYALTEQLQVQEGQILNDSLENYVLPTALDVPAFETRLLEIPEPLGPLGAGGLGEPPLMATAPAIANAVCDALGVAMDRIPMTSERVLAAIQAAAGASASES